MVHITYECKFCDLSFVHGCMHDYAEFLRLPFLLVDP